MLSHLHKQDQVIAYIRTYIYTARSIMNSLQKSVAKKCTIHCLNVQKWLATFRRRSKDWRLWVEQTCFYWGLCVVRRWTGGRRPSPAPVHPCHPSLESAALSAQEEQCQYTTSTSSSNIYMYVSTVVGPCKLNGFVHNFQELCCNRPSQFKSSLMLPKHLMPNVQWNPLTPRQAPQVQNEQNNHSAKASSV